MSLRRKLGWGEAGSRRREPVILVTLPGHQTTTGAKTQQKAGEFPVVPPPLLPGRTLELEAGVPGAEPGPGG